MAGLPGVLIRIGAETKQAITEINSTSKALGGMGSTTKGMASGIRSAMAPAVATLGALTAGGMAAAASASELEQATGAMTAVFGPNTAAMAAAAEAANSLGLSTADYNQQAALLGSLLRNTGTSSDALAGSTSSLITTAADMAAQFGGSTSDAVGALSAMLKGSYEVMDNYGVKLTAAEVSAYAAANGMTTAEAAVALMNEQLAQTGVAGAAAREMDTVASQTAQARAAFEDASAELGDALLPALTDLAGALKTAADWVAKNKDLVIAITVVIGTLAAIVVVLNVAMTVYTVVQWAANTALYGFPVIWIVAAVAAVIAAVVLLWMNWDKITAFFKRTWDAIVDAFGAAVDAIGGFFSDLWGDIKGFINRAIDAVNKLIAAFNKLPGPDLGNIPNVRSAGGAAGASRAAGTTAGGAPSSVVNINFYGPVTDPESTARAIRRSLTGSAVRNGYLSPEARAW
jgi:hypothetical protein